jgi:hypothetical protein
MVEASGSVVVWAKITIPKVVVEVNDNYKDSNSALEDEGCDMFFDFVPSEWKVDIEEVEVVK